MFLRELLGKIALNVDPHNTCPPYVVLIAGGSCSGKTTIANGLVGLLDNGVEGIVISMDDFYVGKSKMEELGIAGNYDIPEAVDIAGLAKFLRMLKIGKKAEKPIYDFRTHERCGSEVISPKEWVFVEGLFALHHRLRRYCDSKVFIDCDERTMLSRRIRRDETERGEIECSIDKYFFNVVLPVYRKRVLPTRRSADIIVEQESLPRLNYH